MNNGNYYEQIDGAAMRSLVSAEVVNLYMEIFEEVALNTQLQLRVETHPAHAFALKIDAEKKKLQEMVAII